MKSMMHSLPRVMSSFFVVVAIAAALFSYWHSMSKLRPDYLQEIIMVDNSTLSDNRNENYLIGYSENADNITTYAEQIMTAYPEIELLYLYPKTKAIAVANVSPNCLKFIRTMSDILYIEPDFHVQAMRVQDDLNKTLEWGIDRIDGKLDNKYHYDYTGRGVRVYVIDSGIRFNHTEFRRSSSSESNESSKSRARCGTNFRKNKGESCLDDWGHGTHVAALIGAFYQLGC
jgi:Subtilase family